MKIQSPLIKNVKVLLFSGFTFLTFSLTAQNTFPDASGNTTFDVGLGTLSPANIFHVHDNAKDKTEFKEKTGLVGDAVKAQILNKGPVLGAFLVFDNFLKGFFTKGKLNKY